MDNIAVNLHNEEMHDLDLVNEGNANINIGTTDMYQCSNDLAVPNLPECKFHYIYISKFKKNSNKNCSTYYNTSYILLFCLYVFITQGIKQQKKRS